VLYNSGHSNEKLAVIVANGFVAKNKASANKPFSCSILMSGWDAQNLFSELPTKPAVKQGEALKRLANWLEEQPLVGGSASIVYTEPDVKTGKISLHIVVYVNPRDISIDKINHNIQQLLLEACDTSWWGEVWKMLIYGSSGVGEPSINWGLQRV